MVQMRCTVSMDLITCVIHLVADLVARLLSVCGVMVLMTVVMEVMSKVAFGYVIKNSLKILFWCW